MPTRAHRPGAVAEFGPVVVPVLSGRVACNMGAQDIRSDAPQSHGLPYVSAPKEMHDLFTACGVITLTTDFGAEGPFVATMKGRILTRFPAA